MKKIYCTWAFCKHNSATDDDVRGVCMKTLKEVIAILSDFPMVDQDYVLGFTEDGKYFFSWNWDIEKLPDEEILAGESGIKYYDTLEEAAQDMKEAIEASEHLLNDEDVQEVLKELNEAGLGA